MELNWHKELSTGAYVAEGIEEDSGEAVELVVEKTGVLSRPWVLRAAGGYVGACRTAKEARRLGDLYCSHGLNTEEGK